MKKIFSIICLALLTLGLVACGGSLLEKVYDLNDILEANDYFTVLQEQNNILSKKVTFADLEKKVITENKEELLSLDENGNYLLDEIYYDVDGKFTFSESKRNCATYQNCNGNLSFEFTNEKLTNQDILDSFFISIPRDASYGEVVVEPLYAYFEVEYMYVISEEVMNEETGEVEVVNNVMSVSSTYFFDLETLLYTNAEHVYEYNSEFLEIVQYKYTYNVENYKQKLIASSVHQNAQDCIELTVVVNDETEDEQSFTYNVSQSSTVIVSDESYRLYKNSSYTKDVTNLEFVYDYATVYYQPAGPEINWTYQLVDEDLDDFIAIRDALQNAIIGNEERLLVEELMEKFNDKFEYVESHYIIGQVNYYKNTKSTKNYDAYMKAVDMYYDMFEEYKNFCKAIWESESIYKEEFFEGWSEEDIETLYVDPTSTEIREKLTEIEEKVNSLNYNAPAWSQIVCNLYKQYVDLSNEYAAYYGYDNYYEYASTGEL